MSGLRQRAQAQRSAGKPDEISDQEAGDESGCADGAPSQALSDHRGDSGARSRDRDEIHHAEGDKSI
jgi:hypothetical protein